MGRSSLLFISATALITFGLTFLLISPSDYPRAYGYELEQTNVTFTGALAASGHALCMWSHLALQYPRTAVTLIAASVVWLAVAQMWRALARSFAAIDRIISKRYRTLCCFVGERSKVAKLCLSHVLFFAGFMFIATIAPAVTYTLGKSGVGGGGMVDVANVGYGGAWFGCIAGIVPVCRALWALGEHADATADIERHAAAARFEARKRGTSRGSAMSMIANLTTSVRRRLSKTPFDATPVGAGGGGSRNEKTALARARPVVHVQMVLSAGEIAHCLRYFTVAACAYVVTMLPLVFRFLEVGASAMRGAAETVTAAQHTDASLVLRTRGRADLPWH